MSKAIKIPLTIKSDFALLDVKKGRQALFKTLGKAGNPLHTPIPVTITGYLTGAWSDDDGISREFEVRVTGVQL
jgi:hypothetical protein